uniref:Uncharacterized protein n=1 Tax=Salix viminalis TaxID=40686 RepID=A0A6N2MHQ4_SALVM
MIKKILESQESRLSRNVIMTGSVLFNGKKRRQDAGLCDTRGCAVRNSYSQRNDHLLCKFKASRYDDKRGD